MGSFIILFVGYIVCFTLLGQNVAITFACGYIGANVGYYGVRSYLHSKKQKVGTPKR